MVVATMSHLTMVHFAMFHTGAALMRLRIVLSAVTIVADVLEGFLLRWWLYGLMGRCFGRIRHVLMCRISRWNGLVLVLMLHNAGK